MLSPLWPLVWLRKTVLRSPPLAVLSTTLVLTIKWTFFKELGQTALLVAFGRIFHIQGGEGAPCKLCDLIVQFALQEAKVDKIRGGIKCDKICWGLGKRCRGTCSTIMEVMKNSTDFPCAAAGICPRVDEFGDHSCKLSLRKLACEPSSQCMLKRGQCELRPGVRQWKRSMAMLREEFALLDDALHGRARYCSEPGAGPNCIHEAQHSSAVVAQWAGHGIIIVAGTGLTIRAIERPGGADSRHWLVFWLISFGFNFVERFTDVLLSSLTIYYELKLLVIIWLMLGGGADRMYRESRRQLAAIRLWLLGAASQRVLDEAAYVRSLPPVVQEAIRAAGSVSAVMSFASDAMVAERFGHEALGALRTIWQHAAPRYVQLRLVAAADLPAPVQQEAEVQGHGGQGYGISRDGYVVPSSDPRQSSSYAETSMDLSIESSDGMLPAYSLAADTAVTNPYCVAYLVPPPPTSTLKDLDAPSRHWWMPSVFSTDGAPGRRWQRLRAFVRCLHVANRLTRRCTSLAAAHDALIRRRFLVAFRRLARYMLRRTWQLLALGRSRLHVKTLLTHAFLNAPLGAFGQYERVCSSVRQRTTAPVWNERLEMRLRGREIGEDGELCNDEAQYSRLRIEVWDHFPHSGDEFLGELSIPLTPLMDGAVHEYVEPLTDPEGRLDGGHAAGRVVFQVSLEK